MQKLFAQKLEDLRRLIEEQRSASSSHSTVMSSERSESRYLYLLAVSGGMDSMCLLDMFSKVVPSSDYAVAHCNFSLRGEESDGDQALVEARAAEFGVRVFVQRFDTLKYAQERGVSIEMAARDLRYGWFSDLCAEHGFDAVVVAHNANDNAETLMLNLLRGTGLNGLHGMSEVSETSVLVFRPLLEFTRKQIEGYVLCNRVPYRHDSSNFESDYKRNKIRNEAFPVFEKINPSFIRTLNREIGYFAEAGDIVEEWCKSQLPSVISSDSPSVMSSERSESRHLHISTPALLATKHWRYLLYYILAPYGFNQQTLSSIESLLTSSRTIPGKRFESDTYILHTGRNVLTIVPRSSELHPDSQNGGLTEEGRALGGNGVSVQHSDVMTVRGDGIYNFNGTRFRVETVQRTSDMPLKQPAGTLIFDAAKLQFPFVCRRWRQGDWLIPLGMRGKKKVSDIFADLKFSAADKSSAVILVDTLTPDLAEQQHVSALLGYRIDDRYKVTSSTRRILLITE